MPRVRKPSSKAIAASEVMPILKSVDPLPAKPAKARAKPPLAPASPSPAKQAQDLAARGPVAPSEYEEIPSAAAFQSLSASTINSSPCKLAARPHVSPHRSRPSPRASPSILKRKRSFDSRMAMFEGKSKGELPTLETVAPPVIKPEDVAEAKFLQAARALQRYQSSESGDEIEEEEGNAPVWDGLGYKKARTAQSEVQPSSSRRRASRSEVQQPPQHEEADRAAEESPRGSKVRDVLLAMAEIAQPEGPQNEPSPTDTAEVSPKESALSMLSKASSGSRPGSTGPNPRPASTDPLSQDTMEADKVPSQRSLSTPAPESELPVGKASEMDMDMVGLLASMATAT